MTATKQRARYHELTKAILYNIASLEIHRAHAHLPPGPVPEVITSTNCAIQTTIAALEGVAKFTSSQAILAGAQLTVFKADPTVAIEVLASIPTDSDSAAG